jgi:putative transposase
VVLRYIERNPLRAELVARAEDWLWSSLGGRETKSGVPVVASPVPLLRKWARWVNEPMTDAEVESLRRRVNRGTPFGTETWARRMAERLGLEASLRPRGRPPKIGRK